MTGLSADYPGVLTAGGAYAGVAPHGGGAAGAAGPSDGAFAAVVDARRRSAWVVVPFLLPVLISAVSYLGGGLPLLSDLSFIAVMSFCVIGLGHEMWVFPRRFGVGGMALYGGVLLWFGYDYVTNWLGVDFHSPATPFTAGVVGKSVFFHALFIACAVAGLLVRRGRWMVRVVHAVPEPPSDSFYLSLVVTLFVVGISPYFLFTAGGGLEALKASILAGRSGAQASWTVGRTGNLNYSWGAYVAQVMQVGEIGGQLAVFYALLVARAPAGKAIGWAIWGLWALLAFGTGARGAVVFVALPMVALVFLKCQAVAAAAGRRGSLRAYVTCAALLLGILAAVQVQGVFRNQGFANVDAGQVSLTELRGNSMFSEGLDAFAAVPESRDYFYNSFPGEGVLRPIPQTLFWLAIGPIPRALWHDKPIDRAWAWRARGRGTDDDLQGTTVSTGLVGNWYVRYGIAGVIEGGLLFGWLLGVAERALRSADGSPMRLLFSLGMLVWLFRCFRDFAFHDLYPLVVGGAAIYALVRVQRLLFGPPADDPSARAGT